MSTPSVAAETPFAAAPPVLVERVQARDFRNYDRLDLQLGPGVTVVCGENGAGKTNALEALYFGCVGRSCRTSNERELVRRGNSVARVEVETCCEGERHLLEVGLEPGAVKRVRVDGAAIEGPRPAPPRPLVSVFLPERLALLKGAPSIRRAHLDQVLAALWPARAGIRTAYSRALAQRNALLARVGTDGAGAESLDAWDAELARQGLCLMEDRRAACELLAPAFASRAAELGLPGEALLQYRPRSRADDQASFVGELVSRRSSDLGRGFTSHGPHRDDVLLAHAGASLRAFGSQGQQRTAVLALLLAERDVLLERTGRAPLLLLDDVMSELDHVRRSRLAELLRRSSQAVVTATEVGHVPAAASADVKVVHIGDGGAVGPPLEVAGRRAAA